MRGLRRRTEALLLLTATPMQVHPVEVWDLLDLLGMPPEWTANAFVRFFDDVSASNPSHDSMDWMAIMFRSCEFGMGGVVSGGSSASFG